MVGRIAAVGIAAVTSHIRRGIGREGAKTVGGKQLVAHAFHHLGVAVIGQHSVRQRNGKYLVGAHAAVKLAIAGFIVPFMFVYSPQLMLIDTSFLEGVRVTVTVPRENDLFLDFAVRWRGGR